MEQIKLMTPSIANKASFSMDKSTNLYFVGSGGGGGGGYGITLKNDYSLDYEYVLGLLNSKLIDKFLQSLSTPFSGGYFAYNRQYIEQLPIRIINFSDSVEVKQHQLMVTLVDYILFLKANVSADTSRDQLMTSYFEQLIDALVYELYLPDEIHVAGQQFFAPLIDEQLPALDEIKGNKLAALRRIFERLYDRNHVIRKNIFFLDTIESVRIIEGKA
jgi:hypothetical protein